jgi:hypothetical protein
MSGEPTNISVITGRDSRRFRWTDTPASAVPPGPLPAIWVAAFKLQGEKQANWQRHAGQPWRDTGLVITTRRGTPYEPAQLHPALLGTCCGRDCAVAKTKYPRSSRLLRRSHPPALRPRYLREKFDLGPTRAVAQGVAPSVLAEHQRIS